MSPFYHDSMPNAPGIYRITCLPTGKIYIGSAINLRYRRKCHYGDLQSRKHRNSKLQRAWNKYGEEAFTFEILELVLLPEMLTAREQHYFDTLKPFGEQGFNLDRIAGSSLGRVVSQESREKSRATQLGRPSTRIGWKPTPEQVERQRRIMTGYKHTEEAKQNMRKAQTGRIHSTESRQKRSQSLRGHPVSDETRAKIGAKSKGRSHTAETRAKMSTFNSTRKRTHEEYESRRKTLILISPDGVEHLVHGIDPFCKKHGLDSSAIAKVARGKYAHHKGWTTRFPESDVS